MAPSPTMYLLENSISGFGLRWGVIGAQARQNLPNSGHERPTGQKTLSSSGASSRIDSLYCLRVTT